MSQSNSNSASKAQLDHKSKPSSTSTVQSSHKPTPKPNPDPDQAKSPKFSRKLKHSFTTIYDFFARQPSYFMAALALGLFIYIILFWFRNFDLLSYIITSQTVPTTTKINLLSATFTSIWSYGLSWQLLGTLIISILQSAIIITIVFMIKQQKSFHKIAPQAGQAGLAGGLAALGLGCSACGTSLITPLLAGISASASHSLSSLIGHMAIFISLVVTLIALYLTGKKLSMFYIAK